MTNGKCHIAPHNVVNKEGGGSMFSKLTLEIKALPLVTEIHPQYVFLEYFIGSDRVALEVWHPDRDNNEYFVFRSIDEMAACAVTRPYIPLSKWERLVDLLHSTQAFHSAPHKCSYNFVENVSRVSHRREPYCTVRCAKMRKLISSLLGCAKRGSIISVT